MEHFIKQNDPSKSSNKSYPDGQIKHRFDLNNNINPNNLPNKDNPNNNNVINNANANNNVNNSNSTLANNNITQSVNNSTAVKTNSLSPNKSSSAIEIEYNADITKNPLPEINKSKSNPS